VSRADKKVEHIQPGDFIVNTQHIEKDSVENLLKVISANPKPIQIQGDFWPSVKKPKVGIYKSWIANMDEGWTRWLLTQYHFDWDTLHNNDVSHLDLSVFSAIILPSQREKEILEGYQKDKMPVEYIGGLGEKGVEALLHYVKEGGSLLVFDAASDFVIEQFGLPLRNVTKSVSSSEFYIPGSLVKGLVDKEHGYGYGLEKSISLSFNNSRAFEIIESEVVKKSAFPIKEEENTMKVNVVVRYAEEELLLSGWALGEEKYLGGKIALAEVLVGKGKVVLYGFRPQFRGQSRGTYKLIFNAIL